MLGLHFVFGVRNALVSVSLHHGVESGVPIRADWLR
jgi:hypothetical protein